MAVSPIDAESVTRAFRLGWEMAGLHLRGRPRREHRGTEPSLRRELPGLSRLPKDRRTEIALDGMDAIFFQIGPALRGCGVAPPDTTDLRQAFATAASPELFRTAVRDLHMQVLRRFAAADSRLERAYTIGRSLNETRCPGGPDDLRAQLRGNRARGLGKSLEDLKSELPEHAARAVSQSLIAWSEWVESHELSDLDFQRISDSLLRQGELWWGLLSGDQPARDLIRASDYAEAAAQIARESQQILGRVLRGYALTILAAALLVAAAIALAVLSSGASAVLASLGPLLAALGIVWKGLGSTLSELGAALRDPLWTRKLDYAVASAIDRRPK